MEVYQVGKTALDEYDFDELNKEDYLWIVYNYHYEDWEGNGVAILLRKDGQLLKKNLSHCSCYGPMDTSTWDDCPIQFEPITLEEILSVKECIFDDDFSDALKEKVKELMNVK